MAHQPRPKEPGGAQFRNLHEEIHRDAKEKREARREAINIEAGGEPGAHIFETVGERIGEFEIGGSARFLHMIAGNRDRVELRHILRGETQNIGNDAERRGGRIDVGVAHHEFLENVVLDRARKARERHVLRFGRHDIKREHRQHRAAHRHRH